LVKQLPTNGIGLGEVFGLFGGLALGDQCLNV